MIAVSGGKGGVGKSTVAVMKVKDFLERNKKVILLDLDIFAPNDHVIIGKSLGEKIKDVFIEYPKINEKKCKKCFLCLKACKNNAILKLNYPKIIKENCKRCFLCKEVCPYNAIEIEKEKIGEIYLNKVSDNFYLISGRIKVGIEEGRELIKEAIEIAKRIREKEKFDEIIIDTTAGLNCNVINAIREVNKVIIVSEDSLLGYNSLKEFIKLAKKLNLKFEVVINKYEGRVKRIVNYLKRNKMKFKFIDYSKKIEELYSGGNLWYLFQ